MSKSSKVFIEKRKKQGDFAAKLPNSGRASVVAPTQEKAIKKAKKMHPEATIQISRVRKTSVGKPDQWR
jgi:hypothetical protein